MADGIDYTAIKRSPHYFKPPKSESRPPRKPRKPQAPRGPTAPDRLFALFVPVLGQQGLAPVRVPSRVRESSVVRFTINGKRCMGHLLTKPFRPRPNGAAYLRGELAAGTQDIDLHLFLTAVEGATGDIYVMPCMAGKHHFPHPPHNGSKYEKFRNNFEPFL